jgi:hypothetical protein
MTVEPMMMTRICTRKSPYLYSAKYTISVLCSLLQFSSLVKMVKVQEKGEAIPETGREGP